MAPTVFCDVENLPNATSYTFTIKATNDVGDSDASAASTAVILRGVQTIAFPAQAAQSFAAGGTFAIHPVATASSGLPVHTPACPWASVR